MRNTLKIAIVMGAAISAFAPGYTQAAAVGVGDIGDAGATEAMPGDAAAQRSNAVIGIGIGAGPDYEGSDSYKASLVPFGRFSYKDYQQYLEFGPNPGSRTYQARLNVLPWQGIEIGPMLTYRAERDHVESQAVRRLGNIDAAGEAGAFMRYWLPVDLPRQGIAAEFSGAADFTDAYNGWWIQPGITYKNAVTNEVTITGRFFADYASDNYMDTYFGVDASQAARSGLRERSADAGFKDVGLTLGATWLFTEHWFTGAVATYQRMVGDAGSSPVTREVGSKNQVLGGGYIGYRF